MMPLRKLRSASAAAVSTASRAGAFELGAPIRVTWFAARDALPFATIGRPLGGFAVSARWTIRLSSTSTAPVVTRAGDEAKPMRAWRIAADPFEASVSVPDGDDKVTPATEI